MASLFEIVDRAHEGKLDDRLRALRAEGLSIEEMTDAFAEDGYTVSRETIRRWCQRIGLPTNRVPATPPPGTASPAGRAEGVNPPDTEEPHASGSPAGGEIEAVAS